MEEREVIELMSEKKNLSRPLSDYGTQKSTAITTAHRLAKFLGDEVVQGSGLSCHLLISKHPIGAPVTELAIPVAIFEASESERVGAPASTSVFMVNDYRRIFAHRCGLCMNHVSGQVSAPVVLQSVLVRV